MRALITGVTGFAGSHLAENLLAHNIDVVGTCLKGESRRNIQSFSTDIVVREVALDDTRSLSVLIDKHRPQWIFHLAALASVGASFDAPIRTMEVNLLGTMRLYEVLRGKKFVEKVVFVSSADVFGPLPPQRMPIKPDYPLRPVSPYGASKAAADIISYQYYRAFGLPIVRIRAFNHTGPRQGTGYVIPDFCSQISRIEKSHRKGVLRVGDLSAKRDIADVRDIVDGYRLAAERGTIGDAYVLASGKADTVENYLHMLIKHSAADISIRVDKRLLRPVEVPLLVGSISKAKRELGYQPHYRIEETLVDTLEYWRKN